MIAALFQPRSGEPDQHTALAYPSVKLFERVIAQPSDIGEHQGRQIAFEQAGYAGGDIFIVQGRDLREGLERPVQIPPT